MTGQGARFAVLAPLLVLALLTGCAVKRPPGEPQATPPAAWSAFRAVYLHGTGGAEGLLVHASLYYSAPRGGVVRGNRTVVDLWGDFGRPLRLDVRAGIGTSLAFLREAGDGLTAFYPGEKRVYFTHGDPARGARRLGLPLPFSLDDLARVLAGSLDTLVTDRSPDMEATADGFVYRLASGPVRGLTLDETGRPVLMEGPVEVAGADGAEEEGIWRLRLDKYPDADEPDPWLARRLVLELPGNRRGVLHIMDRELRLDRWEQGALRLTVPDGVETVPLDRPVAPLPGPLTDRPANDGAPAGAALPGGDA